MSRNNEEDTFNKLMGTPSEGRNAEKSNLESNSGTEANISNEDLMEKYAHLIGTVIDKIPNLEMFLKAALGPSFTKIRGAWDQFQLKEIGSSELVQSGIYVLGLEFVQPFLNFEKGKKKGIITPPPVQEERKLSEAPKIIEKSKPLQETNVSQESSKLRIKIPSMLLSGAGGSPKAPITPLPSTTKIESPIKSEETIKKSIPSFTLSRIEPTMEKIDEFTPKKIESIAPKKEILSQIDALKKVGEELEKVGLTPIKFAKLDEDEIKSVNVAASLPGTQLHDDFENVREMIYAKRYDSAERRLKELKILGEKKNNEFLIGKSEEMLTNMAVYKMIPDLLKSAEAASSIEKAKEIYEKTLSFLQVLRDVHYTEKVNKRISEINEKLAFSRLKKEAENQDEVRMKKLIRDNIRRLGKNETMMKIEEIRKYCAAKSEEIVIEILVDMIQNREIYAKFFPESKKVIFDKDANRDLFPKI